MTSFKHPYGPEKRTFCSSGQLASPKSNCYGPRRDCPDSGRLPQTDSDKVN